MLFHIFPDADTFLLIKDFLFVNVNWLIFLFLIPDCYCQWTKWVTGIEAVSSNNCVYICVPGHLLLMYPVQVQNLMQLFFPLLPSVTHSLKRMYKTVEPVLQDNHFSESYTLSEWTVNMCVRVGLRMLQKTIKKTILYTYIYL